VKTYQIRFDIKTDTDPAEWDWGSLLGLKLEEEFYMYAIKIKKEEKSK
jgi:hypothetical protein